MAHTCANSLVVSFVCDAVKSGIPASAIAFDSWFATPWRCKLPLMLRIGELFGKDLRGTVALLLAALSIRATTILHGIENIERGYENLFLKLNQLGLDIACICGGLTRCLRSYCLKLQKALLWVKLWEVHFNTVVGLYL